MSLPLPLIYNKTKTRPQVELEILCPLKIKKHTNFRQPKKNKKSCFPSRLNFRYVRGVAESSDFKNNFLPLHFLIN